MLYLRMMRVYIAILFLLLSVGCEKEQKSQRYQPTGKIVKETLYKVGIHPYLNSKKMYSSYRPILDYLERHLDGVRFRLETSTDYAQYDLKLYRGDFDFSLPNSFQTYNSLSKGYHVIAKMKPDSVFRGIFVARKDAHLKSVMELKGGSISFPAPTALAATMMPLYYLHERGIDVERDIEKRYVGSQYSAILNAYSSDTLVGATWPPPWEAWVKENPQKAAQMEVVWETESLVNNGFVVRSDINGTIAKRVADELVKLSTTNEGRKLLRGAGFEGFEYGDDRVYDKVKKFLEKYDKAIGIPK